jgi:uncharacterized protein YjbI with pentapeptide repeats
MIQRDSEIKQIQQEYSWFYPLLMGGLLVIVGIVIGASVFGSDDSVFEGNMLAYSTNLWTEAISIGITVFILDQINRRRDQLAAEAKEHEQKAEAEKSEKQRLIVQLRSTDNATALTTLEQLKEKGWAFDGTLNGANLRQANLQDAKLWFADLQGAKLLEANLQGANLWRANLQGSDLRVANLQGAKLLEANLQGADLTGTNLQGADLTGTNLQGADLKGTNLQGADLLEANLEGADLTGTNLQGAVLYNVNLQSADLYNVNLQGADLRGVIFDEKIVLPDAQENYHLYDKYWTPETDMRRYTDPNHPDFWQPDWVKEQKE